MLNIKSILTILLIFLDLFIIIGLTAYIGIKLMGFFIIGYIIGFIVSPIIVFMVDKDYDYDWEKYYIRNGSKINWLMTSASALFFIGLSLLQKNQTNLLIVASFGALAGAMTTVYMMMFCRDLLFIIDNYREVASEMIIKSFSREKEK